MCVQNSEDASKNDGWIRCDFLPKKMCAVLNPPSISGVLEYILSVRMSSCNWYTLIAGFGEFHLLNKLPSGDAGIYPYLVECLKVSLIRLIGIHMNLDYNFL